MLVLAVRLTLAIPPNKDAVRSFLFFALYILLATNPHVAGTTVLLV